MSSLTLTLANPKILKYFQGTSDIPPTGELLYAHTHPMMPNFLSEIEILVNITATHFKKNPQKAGAAAKLVSITESFAAKCNKIDEKSAPGILEDLRKVYQFCERFAEMELRSK